MSKIKKGELSGDSILEAYRKLKSEQSEIGLSQKVMDIARAGIAGPETCILCDSRDVCDTCDATDFLCLFGDDTGWCVFTDAIDIDLQ
jgi:hypothetical protein